jgi:septin 3/9/12
LGKSTLVNTIFASHLIESKARLLADEPPRQTTEIQTVSHCNVLHSYTIPFFFFFFFFFTNTSAVIEENGVRLRLNIVDTPGYGDQVNNENW